MNDFRAFLESLGLVPGAIVADERVRSCPTESHPRKKNGRYWLAADERFGWGQDWAVHAEVVKWRPARTAELPPPPNPAEVQRRLAAERERQRSAIRQARAFFASCAPLRGGHTYLESHGLSMRGCSGIKVDGKGWLVVPMMRGGSLVSVQRISPDGEKRFWPGAPTGGTAYVIERRTATLTVICEGLATGLACYAVASAGRVIVCWTAGNLARFAETPNGFVVVAADNDYRTAEKLGRNPGIDAARELAKRLGCGVAYPEGISGTDWADWRREHLAERIEKRPPRSRETNAMAQKVVDAALERELTRHAVFLAAERKAG